MENLKELNKYLLRYKLRFLLGAIFVGLHVFFSILIPPTLRNALDLIQDKVRTIDEGVIQGAYVDVFGSDIIKFAGLVIGLSILSGFFMICMRLTMIVMSRLIEYDMRKDIYEKYQSLDMGFYKRNRTGDLMSRVSSDVSKVRMYLGPGLMYGVRVTFLFSFIIYSMFQVNVTLALYTLLPLPFLSLSIYYVSSVINKRSAAIQVQVAKLNSIAQEVYSGIRIIKSYVKEDQFQGYYNEQAEDYKAKALRLARVQALFFPLMVLLVSLSTLLTIYIGGKLYMDDSITAGNILEFILYINILTWPITSIGWIASIVQEAEASQARINAIMSTTPSILNKSEDHSPLKGRIEFKNVTFTYPDTNITALKNVSFIVEKGEKLVIVGRTAAGKTTIADLLLRYYDVDSGEITIDGINIQEHNLQNLRQKIGYVPQNVFLFSETIEENIKFGTTDATHETVEHYADLSAIKKDINGFEEKFQTKVGERGVTLSGGQKQRISIARALIKKPHILILDDCLSAVDANTEYKILGHLDEILEDKSAIIITHRLSNLLNFDKVLILEQGELTALGTHEELMQKEGYYKELVQHQYSEEIS